MTNVTMDKTKENVIEFEVDVEGIDAIDMSVCLNVETPNMTLRFKAIHQEGNKWSVKIPVLSVTVTTPEDKSEEPKEVDKPEEEKAEQKEEEDKPVEVKANEKENNPLADILASLPTVFQLSTREITIVPPIDLNKLSIKKPAVTEQEYVLELSETELKLQSILEESSRDKKVLPTSLRKKG